MLLRYGFYVWVLLVCTACGGGGGGGSSSSGGGSSNDNSLTATGARFPALSPAPGNNAAMLSCQTNTAPPVGTITGTVHYQRVPITTSGLDYNNIQDLPARGVVVQAVAAVGASCSTTIVATALTNGSGQYGLNVPAGQVVCIEVRAQLYRDGDVGGPSWDVQVVDNTNAQAPYYLLDSTPATPVQRPVRDLLAGTGWNAGAYSGDRAAAPFAILDAVCEAINVVVAEDPDVQLPLLKMNWSERNTTAEGNVEEGDIGGAFYRQIHYFSGSTIVAVDRDIFLRGSAGSDTDEYDPHVINHEFGHYLVSVLSATDTIGGDHYLSDRLDARVAFDEGFASAFAGISLDGSNVVTNSHIYKDSFGWTQNHTFSFAIDDSDPYSNKGWYSEPSAYSLIYNTYDGVSGADTVSLGFGPLLNVMTSIEYLNSPSLLTLFTFFHVLKEQSSVSDRIAIDALLAQENFEEITDAFGSGESAVNNDVSGTDVVPVYLTLTQGMVQEACSRNDLSSPPGTYNKLSNGRFLRFNPSAANYRFDIVPINAGRPVVEVYERGGLLLSREASFNGETISFNLYVGGEVVIVVYDYGNYQIDSSSSGRFCFNVLVS